MNLRKTAVATLFVALLTIPSILGLIPLSIHTPAGTVSLEANEAQARARNTNNNRLRDIRVPTSGASLSRNFRPTTHRYTINLHQNRARVVLEPQRRSGQDIRHRIDTRRANRSWNNGNWSSWRSGSNANSRIAVRMNHGQERRVRIAVRDRDGNIRTYTVTVRRAANNAWGANLRANSGAFNRSFERRTMNYTLLIPHNRSSVRVRMDGARSNAQLRTRIGSGNWSSRTFSTTSRNVSVPRGGSRTLQIQVRGAFTAAAPSPTHTRTYTITINRAATAAEDPPVQTAAIPTFTLRGVGWGHGVGMSQNGAMQMSREGHNFRQILRHYFTGVTVETRTPPRNVRVNLDRGMGTRSSWRIGPATGQAASRMSINGSTVVNGASAPFTFRVVGGNIEIRDRNNQVVNYTGSRTSVALRPDTSPSVLTVLDTTGSLTTQPTRYRSRLQVEVVNGRLRLVNILSMQRYLYGVVPREIPSGVVNTTTRLNIFAAIQAQAVAARTYAMPFVTADRIIGPTVAHQVYGGHSRFANEAAWRNGTGITLLEAFNSNTAVDTTNNMVIMSGGQIRVAYYSACNGNRTANSEDVWMARLPHLRSVSDPFCGRSGHAGHSWTVRLTGMELADRLRRNNASVPSGAGRTVYVRSLSRDVATGGWVRTLTVNWSNGSRTRIGNADNVRIRLGLRSSNFTVSRTLPAGRASATGTMSPLSARTMSPLISEATTPLSAAAPLSLPLEGTTAKIKAQEGDYSPFYVFKIGEGCKPSYSDKTGLYRHEEECHSGSCEGEG